MKKTIFISACFFVVCIFLYAQEKETFQYDKESYYKAAYDTLQSRLSFTKKNYKILKKNNPDVDFYKGNIEKIKILPVPFFKFKSDNDYLEKRDSIENYIDFINKPSLQYSILYLDYKFMDIINLIHPARKIERAKLKLEKTGELLDMQIVIDKYYSLPSIKVFTTDDFLLMNENEFFFSFLNERCIVIDGTFYVIKRYSPDFKGVYYHDEYITKGFIVKDNMALFEMNYYFKNLLSVVELKNEIEESLSIDDED